MSELLSDWRRDPNPCSWRPSRPAVWSAATSSSARLKTSVSGPSWCDKSWGGAAAVWGPSGLELLLVEPLLLYFGRFGFFFTGCREREEGWEWAMMMMMMDWCWISVNRNSHSCNQPNTEVLWFNECRQVKSYSSLRTPVGLDKLHRCTLDPATFVLEGQQLVIWGEMHRIHEQVGLKDKTLPSSLHWKWSCVAGAIIKASHPVSRAHLSATMFNPQIFHPWHMFAPCWQVAVQLIYATVSSAQTTGPESI